MVYYTLYLGYDNRQKSRWKVRIYADENNWLFWKRFCT